VILTIAALCLVVVAVLLAKQDRGEDVRIPAARDTQAEPGAIGTSGTDVPKGADENAGPAAVVAPAIIQELETITGSVDGNELVGRRVDLHVTVREIANETAFWIGEGDNRVLVVLGRDTRDGDDRQRGLPPSHRILTVHAGQQATVSGSVRRLPRAEEMHSWDLTRTDMAELRERPVYIRADAVTTNGHGTF
jgi:hypothetical protein